MDDGLNYSMEARIRVAVSACAAQVHSEAASLVPTYGEYGCMDGELAEAAARLVQLAAEAMTLAIACERQRGVNWEQIAEAVGESAATVRERYERPVSQLRQRLLESWLDPERAVSLPEGATDPGRTARRLDRWLTDDPERDVTLVHHPDPEIRARPVSGELPIMSLSEHRDLLASAARLIINGDQSPGVERNLRRQRIVLLEWLLAEELNRPRATGSLDQQALRQIIIKEREELAASAPSNAMRKAPPASDANGRSDPDR